MSRSVTFLTRRNCGLCREALPRVERGAGRLGLNLEVVDVDDAGLADRFGGRVPALIDATGRVVAEGRMPSIWWALAKVRLRR